MFERNRTMFDCTVAADLIVLRRYNNIIIIFYYEILKKREIIYYIIIHDVIKPASHALTHILYK